MSVPGDITPPGCLPPSPDPAEQPPSRGYDTLGPVLSVVYDREPVPAREAGEILTDSVGATTSFRFGSASDLYGAADDAPPG